MDQLVERTRRFNRFYTRAIGVVADRYLGTNLSLAQARVIYELAERGAPTASDIAGVLQMDAGYLSRILKGLQTAGLVARVQAERDRRQRHLTLTDSGRAVFARLEADARRDMAALLQPLAPEARGRLAQAMDAIEAILAPGASEPVSLRPPRSGDLGWVVERHGALYGAEYGWNMRFEAHVARIVGELTHDPDPLRERCWIAEQEGRRMGCVFLARDSDTVARIRLLLLEPAARGLGLGRRLVEECLAFARQAGYREVVLWTHAELTAARHIYASLGFQMIAEEEHDHYGPMAMSETWKLAL